MRKRFMALFLAGCLAAALTGCGGNGGQAGTTAASAAATTAATGKDGEKAAEKPGGEAAEKAAEEGDKKAADAQTADSKAADSAAKVGEPAQAASSERPVVCLLMSKTTSAYSGAYFSNFKEKSAEYPDVDWIAFDAQNDPTLQAQQAEEAIAMGASCIMMQPIDGTALIAAAKKISEAGIPLVICNKKLTEEGEPYYTTYFGPDCYLEGQLAADLLHEKYPDGCKYVHLGQDTSDEVGRLRLAGFEDQAKEKGYNFECLGVSPSCNWSAENGKTYMAAFLTKFSGEIDAVWAIDDAVGYGALQAVQEDLSGENEKVQIVSVGGQEANLNAIKEGKNYLGTIYQSPILESGGAMKIVNDIVVNNIVPSEKSISMELPVITIDNANDYPPAY
ncbi:sugar ABC transporter substrate-binding protein [Clostridium sp. MCC353]|uniref:sugar ABC transporter substrate-binding protein n=1 Tax=Clostridium sp. MCC353 TaxID=2592646 RepID=UPI001C035945|nr:sugar ABC transporter substrate-binding protein [Clostridium sp. MCC353]